MTTHALSAPAFRATPSVASASTRRLPRVLTHAARVLLGIPLLISGANSLFHIFPDPQVSLPHGAALFLGALAATGYMLQLIALTQLVAGLLLAANRYVPLALALIAPFIVNSIAFHLFLEPSGRVPAFFFLSLELVLAWRYRAAFAPMLRRRNVATAS